MSRTVITDIQKRFSDIDVFCHVNNVHQQEYLDAGKTDYYREVLGFDVFRGQVTLIIVSIKTDFMGQIRYGDDIFVKTRVSAIGTKSITVSQQIVCRTEDGREQLLTRSETVLVAYDRRKQCTTEVPDEWRKVIARDRLTGCMEMYSSRSPI